VQGANPCPRHMTKYTIKKLKEKYWEFKKTFTEKTSGYYAGSGYFYIEYPNTLEGFLMWLEDNK